MARREIDTIWDRETRNNINENFKELYGEVGNIVDTISDEVFQEIVNSAKLVWQKQVPTYNDIATTYPNPEEGWAVYVEDEGNVYRYDGSGWVQIQNIDPGPYNQLQDDIDAVRNEEATETFLGRVRVDGETIKVNSGTISTKNNKIPVFTPSGFNWTDHPLQNKIFTDGYGNFYIKDFNIRKYRPRGKVYYVDVNNGDDDNDGLTLGTALQTVKAAYDKSDCVVIKIAEGVYNREQSMWGRTINRDLCIEALPGHDVLLTQTYVVNWQPDTRTNVYYANTSNVEFILDTTFVDENGDYYKYEQVGTADEVEANPGTYAIESSTTYIHTFDSREPDNETIWRFTDGDAIKVEGNCTLYLEGIKQWGGNSPLIVLNSSSTDTTKVFAKDCEFKYSNDETYDVVRVKGVELAIFENCSATNGLKDGFNYDPLNGIVSKAIEINCVGKFNGNDADGNDQGSTQHAGGKIIRINGDYNNNYGSNLADNGAGTQSWNLGCIGFESLSPYTSQRSNFYAYTDVDMWLDGCVGFSVGTDGSDIGGAGNIFVKNNNLLSSIKVADGTTVTEY